MNSIVGLKKYSLDSKEHYNEEPVYYCKECLSLKIMVLDDSEFCDNCGSSNIELINIKDWEKLYINKYGHKYLSDGGN